MEVLNLSPRRSVASAYARNQLGLARTPFCKGPRAQGRGSMPRILGIFSFLLPSLYLVAAYLVFVRVNSIFLYLPT